MNLPRWECASVVERSLSDTESENPQFSWVSANLVTDWCLDLWHCSSVKMVCGIRKVRSWVRWLKHSLRKSPLSLDDIHIISLSKIESYTNELFGIAKQELPVGRMYRHEIAKMLKIEWTRGCGIMAQLQRSPCRHLILKYPNRFQWPSQSHQRWDNYDWKEYLRLKRLT